MHTRVITLPWYDIARKIDVNLTYRSWLILRKIDVRHERKILRWMCIVKTNVRLRTFVLRKTNVGQRQNNVRFRVK